MWGLWENASVRRTVTHLQRVDKLRHEEANLHLAEKVKTGTHRASV